MKKCLGCFESLRDDLEICPFCGYYDGSADSSVYLVPGTILSGRYKIGNLIESDDTSAKYLAYDMSSKIKVEIKEFFPQAHAVRDVDSHKLSPKPEFESQFNKGFQLFVEDAKRLFADSGTLKIYDCIAENNSAYLIMEHVDDQNREDKSVNPVIARKKDAMPVEKKQVTDNNRKIQSNKKIIGILAIASLALILIGIGIFATVTKLSSGLAPSSYVFLADGQYQYMSYVNREEPVNFDALKSDDYTSSNLVKFSPDGKYIYYFTRIDDDDYVGTLCRIETSKIKSNLNSDKYVETISSNVKLNCEVLDNGFVLFKKDEGQLCCYDGKEVIKVAKDVASFYVSEDNKQLIYLTQGEYYENYTLYGCYFKNLDDKIKLASDVYSMPLYNDFENIMYTKISDDGDFSLHCVGFNKTSERVANKAVYITSSDDNVYYAAITDSVSLYSYVKDRCPNDYNYFREALKDEYYNQPIYSIYLYKNGQSTLISKNVLSFKLFDGLIAFNTTDMVTKKLDIDELEGLYEVYDLLSIDYSDSFNVLPLNSDTPIPMTSQGTELLESDNGYYSIDLLWADNKLFLLNDGEELYVANISNKSIGQFDLVAEDVFYSYVEDGFLYFRNGKYEVNDSEYYDQYVYKNGKAVKIAWDCSYPNIYEDGIVIADTDKRRTSKDTYYEISMFYSNGDKIKIADDVNWYIRVDKKNVLYISDGDLYRFDGKEKTRIATDVDCVWCSKYMETV